MTRVFQQVPQITLVTLAALSFFISSATAQAYSIQSGSTEGCHERITGIGFKESAGFLNTVTVIVPNDDIWQKLYGLIRPPGHCFKEYNNKQKFILFSMLMGSRTPDTGNHSIYNLDWLRKIHAAPDPQVQYSHFTRATTDDYAQGDQNVIDGSRAIIRALVNQAETAISRPAAEQLHDIKAEIDFYGPVDVTVWEPAYRIGEALHTVQDSFSHTIRTEQDQFHSLAHITNYVDAITDHYQQERDGLAHSDNTDKCYQEEQAPLMKALDKCTLEYLKATEEKLMYANDGPFNIFMNDWFQLEPGCTIENDMCDNPKWLKLSQKHATGPYLGCSTVPGTTTAPKESLLVLLLIMLALFVRSLLRRRT